MTQRTKWDMLRAGIPSLLCTVILCGILVAGLWPFGRPPNTVAWLGDANGLRFTGTATAWSIGQFQAPASQNAPSCSLDLWLQAGSTSGSKTILAFSTAENPLQLSIHQYRALLILTRSIQGAARRTATIGIDGVFRQIKPVFITIASGPQETTMYVDGVLARKFPRFSLENGCTGQLVIGTSPVEGNGWPGQVRGLAIFSQELSAAQAAKHYQSWTVQGRPDLSGGEQATALYLFDERSGNVVHNSVPGGIDLFIPQRYSLLHQRFLQPFWKEYRPSLDYWQDTLINILGFIPLGFVFYAYWSSVRPIRHAVLFTTVFGFVVSLTIELLQSHLPTRESGTTDLITNTLGTFLGVRLYGWKLARALLAKIYPE